MQLIVRQSNQTLQRSPEFAHIDVHRVRARAHGRSADVDWARWENWKRATSRRVERKTPVKTDDDVELVEKASACLRHEESTTNE